TSSDASAGPASTTDVTSAGARSPAFQTQTTRNQRTPMADIAPLTPLRYDLARLAGSLAAVVAPPYDVISPEERTQLAARHAHNVVRLILPEGEGDTKYGNAARILSAWRDEGVLVRDATPAFYRLDQTFLPPGTHGGARAPIRRRGFLALVRLVPFAERV